MAYYGQSSTYEPLETPESQFFSAMDRVARMCNVLQQTIDDLEKALPKETKGDDVQCKPLYLKMQKEFYNSIQTKLLFTVNLMKSNPALLNASQAVQGRMYGDMTKILNHAEQNMRRALGIPEETYLQMYERAKNLADWAAKNPAKAAAASGGAFGLAFAAGAAGLYHLKGYCVLYHFFLQCPCASAVGMVTSAATCGLVGAVVGLAVYCGYSWVRSKFSTTQLEMCAQTANSVKELREALQRFESVSPAELVEQLSELSKICAVNFCQVHIAAGGSEDKCCICLDGFGVDKPGIAPVTCKRREPHLVHPSCYANTIQQHGDFRCQECQS